MVKEWNKESLYENFTQVISKSKIDNFHVVFSICNAGDYVKSTREFTKTGFIGAMQSYVNNLLYQSTWDQKLFTLRLFFSDDCGFYLKTT